VNKAPPPVAKKPRPLPGEEFETNKPPPADTTDVDQPAPAATEVPTPATQPESNAIGNSPEPVENSL
jgi:monofunctional biosynthetic peptidoglycan transglycosylase